MFTDHQSLLTILKKKTESNIINNWLWTIQQHDFDVVHLPGFSNIIPDRLSRIRWDREPHAKVNLLKKQSTSSFGNEIKQMIKEIYLKEDIPEHKRAEFISEIHEKFGHCSAKTLFKEIWREGYYYPSLMREVTQFVQQCITCLSINTKRHGYIPIQSIDSSYPFEKISIDWVKFTTEKKNNVLIVKDLFTNFILLRIFEQKAQGEEVAKILLNIFADFGTPRVIHTDNGTEFCNSEIKDLLDKYSVEHLIGTPYHQNSNSVETSVKEVQRILSKIISDKNQWREYIPVVQIIINTRITREIGRASCRERV